MFIWIARIIVILAGPIIGWFQISPGAKGILIGTGIAIGIILIEMLIEKVHVDDLIAGGLGVIVGLILAKLLDYAIIFFTNEAIASFFVKYSLMIKIVFGYVGFIIAIKKKSEIAFLDKNIPLTKSLPGKEVKLLDTSSLIDGRILDIIKENFLEGVFVIPLFILGELHALADSSDATKRTRARRGLDILKEMEKLPTIVVKTFEKNYPKIPTVDAKLIRMAVELKGGIVTCDFGLNKVAGLQGVKVYNINALANALRPVALPGQVLEVFINREGEKERQGVGYLDDGTMVAVNEARQYIGKKVEVEVESILQTGAGRMIFARIKSH